MLQLEFWSATFSPADVLKRIRHFNQIYLIFDVGNDASQLTSYKRKALLHFLTSETLSLKHGSCGTMYFLAISSPLRNTTNTYVEYRYIICAPCKLFNCTTEIYTEPRFEKGSYFRDRVPIRAFLTFWSLFSFQGPNFQCFRFRRFLFF